MRDLLHRLHVRYRWLRYQANYYDSLWRVFVVRYRMWRLVRQLKKMKWIPMEIQGDDGRWVRNPAFDEAVARREAPDA